MKKICYQFLVITIMTLSFTTSAKAADGIGFLLNKEYGKHAGDNVLQQVLLVDVHNKDQKKAKKDAERIIALSSLENFQSYYKAHLAHIFPGESYEDVVNGTAEDTMPASFIKEYLVGYIQNGTNILKFFPRAPNKGERCLVYKGIIWASTYCWNPVRAKRNTDVAVVSSTKKAAIATKNPETGAGTETVSIADKGGKIDISITINNKNENINTNGGGSTVNPGYNMPPIMATGMNTGYASMPQAYPLAPSYGGCIDQGYDFGGHLLGTLVNTGGYLAKKAIQNNYRRSNRSGYQQSNYQPTMYQQQPQQPQQHQQQLPVKTDYIPASH